MDLNTNGLDPVSVGDESALDRYGQEIVAGPAQEQPPLPPTGESISPARGELQESLRRDIVKAGQAQTQTGQRLGLAQPVQGPGMAQPEPGKTFQEKGIMVGERVVAQDLLKTVLQEQGAAIKDFVTSSGLTDQTEQAAAGQALTNRLNKIRQELLTRGLEFQKVLAKQKATAEEERQAAANWGSLAGSLVGGIIGNAILPGLGGMLGGAAFGGKAGGSIGGGS